jgi:arylsulfatase A-like enzyme
MTKATGSSPGRRAGARAARRIAVATALAVGFTSSSADGQRPPNIVVIVADDMGYADIGVHGARDIPTPNIDALAQGGIRFTDAYVTGPYCSPTRAGLLTGRYPQRFGHEFNLGLNPGLGLPLDEKTLADRLKAAGYRTALFGKWHLGADSAFHPMSRGFDEFFGFLGGAHSYFDVMADTQPILDGRKPAQAIGYLTDTLSARAVDFIKRQRSQPFFLYLAYNAVHTPMHATDKYLARFKNIGDEQRRTYAAMLSAMDDGIGRQTWEGGIRVPFIMRWKGRLAEGKVDSRPIIQLDVFPTALAVAGVTATPEWKLDGVNLLPFLTTGTAAEPHEALYWRLGSNMAIRKGDWKLVRTQDGALRAEHDELRDLSSAQLFNLETDIGEKNDLSARYPDRKKELADAWQRWNQELAVPRWRPGRGAGPGEARPPT